MNIRNTAMQESARGHFFCGLFLLLLSAYTNAEQQALTLDAAINAAVQNDPWLQGNRYQQNSLESMSIAAGTLPDPKVSIGIANIAADSFDFGQEAMTQFKVGISQMLPRGDSLAIKQQQLNLLASEHPFQREDHKAKLKMMVSKIWLDVYKAQQSIVLIEKDRGLFEQLADVAQASYASTIGKTRQQDIVRAQLELTRLDDRLTVLKQQKEVGLQKLSEWLSSYFLEGSKEQLAKNVSLLADDILLQTSPKMVTKETPNIDALFPEFFLSKATISNQELFEFLVGHPSIVAFEQRIKSSKSGIALAKQKYKPEWGINASYGYRDDTPLGQQRSDLFSIGVSFDIPLFTGNRQDKQVQSAISKSSAIKTQKWQLLRHMIASVQATRTQLLGLNQRQMLYRDKLIPQMHDQAEASLSAYTNDNGDFSEVIRSKIAELNASIDALGIDVERQKNIVQLNYFFIGSADKKISQIENRNAGEIK